MAFGYMMFLFMILFTVCCSSVWTRDAVGVCIWFKFKKEIWFWEIWEISLTGRILFFFHGGLKWCVCPWTFTKLHSLLWLFFLLHIKHGDKQTCWETLAVTRPSLGLYETKPQLLSSRLSGTTGRDVVQFSLPATTASLRLQPPRVQGQHGPQHKMIE